MARKPRARYLQVKGWWDFQHYPDKVAAGWTPPWIKTYASLLEDYTYNSLSELDRGRLHRIWLLAARLDNKIPWDEKFIRTAIHASSSFSLQPFIHSGMLLEWADNATVKPPRKTRKPRNQAAKPLDGVYAASMPEQSRAEEKEKRHRPLDQLGDWQPLPIDIEKERELQLIHERLRGTTDKTMDALRKASTGVPFGGCAKVREFIQSKPAAKFGVGYAINALRSEAEAA